MRKPNVELPLEFSIRAKDQFYPRAFDRTGTQRFYVDATYNPPGLKAGYGLFRWRAPAVTGEAWGPEGVPSSLARGDAVEVVLDRYWSRAEIRGQLERWPDALAEGWMFIVPEARATCLDNRLTLAFRSADAVVAVKRFDDIDPARPVAYHLMKSDFRVEPTPQLRAYVSAWFECFEEGQRTRVVVGGRASVETTISAYPHTLRVALWEDASDGPEAVIPELETLVASPRTYQ